MFMRKIKFKILVLLMCFITINQYSLNVFADTTSDDIPSSNIPSIENTNSSTNNESTVLDGEIGEWNPELDDNPNFSDEKIEEIDGDIPKENEYYTISVTVPLNMEFFVLPNSQMAFGSFYSPMYTIKNNGTKNISVSLYSFEKENTIVDEDSTQLYIETLNHEDDKTQMELKICGVEDLNTKAISKKIDLTKINTLSEDEKKLYVLGTNETKGIKFASDNWELPQYASNKRQAISNFTARFMFSVVRIN